MALAIPAWDLPTVPVAGGRRFPVRRIYCVGRNYAAHAREMGSDPDREPPFFFLKPADAVVPVPAEETAHVDYPVATKDYQHEIELVAAIGRGGADISSGQALDHIFGYAVGLDMTRRDLQMEARGKGRPWDMGKGFDRSAPCGEIQPADLIGHPAHGAIWVKVDGAVRQSADLGDLIWSVPEIVAHLSALVRLEPGDLIYTGTPEGVGPVERGQVMEGHVDGVGDIRVAVD